MSRSGKVWAVVLALIAVTALLYIAASDKIFFVNQQLTPDTVVYTERDGFAFPFYKDGVAVTVATVYHRVSPEYNDIVPILFELIPRDKYRFDSLHLEFLDLMPALALMLENPEDGSPPAYNYSRSDSGSTVLLDFPGFDSADPATITINFWLDMSVLDPATPDKLTLDIAFTLHEDSILKIVKYSAKIAIQVDIPSAA
jgi:hypothetical protein